MLIDIFSSSLCLSDWSWDIPSTVFSCQVSIIIGIKIKVLLLILPFQALYLPWRIWSMGVSFVLCFDCLFRLFWMGYIIEQISSFIFVYVSIHTFFQHSRSNLLSVFFFYIYQLYSRNRTQNHVKLRLYYLGTLVRFLISFWYHPTNHPSIDHSYVHSSIMRINTQI